MAATVLYAQTADALRKRIGEGWQVGDRIPSESKLCEEFGVSSITMRRAVGTLVAEGLLVRLQGKGTFVTADHAIVQGPPDLTSFTQDMVTRGWGSSSRVVGITIEPGSAEICLRLGVSAGSALTRIERVRLADGQPIAIQVAYLPSIAFPGLERFDFGRDSLYEVLRRHYEVQARPRPRCTERRPPPRRRLACWRCLPAAPYSGPRVSLSTASATTSSSSSP